MSASTNRAMPRPRTPEQRLRRPAVRCNNNRRILLNVVQRCRALQGLYIQRVDSADQTKASLVIITDSLRDHRFTIEPPDRDIGRLDNKVSDGQQ